MLVLDRAPGLSFTSSFLTVVVSLQSHESSLHSFLRSASRRWAPAPAPALAQPWGRPKWLRPSPALKGLLCFTRQDLNCCVTFSKTEKQNRCFSV